MTDYFTLAADNARTQAQTATSRVTIALTCRFASHPPVAYHYSGGGYSMVCAGFYCCLPGEPAETLELAVERWDRFHAIGRPAAARKYGVVQVIEVPEKMVS